MIYNDWTSTIWMVFKVPEKLHIKSKDVYKKRDILISLLVIFLLLTSSSERCSVEMSKLWCAAMQMDFSLPCWKGWQRGNIASIFSLSLYSFFCEGLSCLGSLESKCMIIIPPLFIATLYRILTAWQFHIGWKSWPYHIAEIDLACCDFLWLLKAQTDF